MKNLRNYFAILSLCLLFSLASAKDGGPEKIGIRAGYQASGLFMDAERLPGTKNLGAFYAGLFRDNKIVPFLFLGTGLEYMQAGTGFENNDDKLVLHYLSVPVYVKTKLGPIYALGGAAANIKFAEKSIVDGKSTDVPDDQKRKNFDVPVYLGAGFKFLMFSVEGRYHWGMLDQNLGIKNQYLQLGATISF